jgi:hypothetical protein
MNTMNLNIDNKNRKAGSCSFVFGKDGDKPKNKMNDGMVYRLTIAKKWTRTTNMIQYRRVYKGYSDYIRYYSPLCLANRFRWESI